MFDYYQGRFSQQSHYAKFWLAGSHGGGITYGMSYIEIAVGQSAWMPWFGRRSELGVAA